MKRSIICKSNQFNHTQNGKSKLNSPCDGIVENLENLQLLRIIQVLGFHDFKMLSRVDAKVLSIWESIENCGWKDFNDIVFVVNQLNVIVASWIGISVCGHWSAMVNENSIHQTTPEVILFSSVDQRGHGPIQNNKAAFLLFTLKGF